MFNRIFYFLSFWVILKSASITTQSSSLLCDDNIQEFTSKSGTITSYNYPSLYEDNQTCQFSITVMSDEIIIVNFESFTTQAIRDILKVYDGQNTSSALVRSLGANFNADFNPPILVSRSNYLYFNFTTDNNITKNGFKLNYKSFKKVSIVNLTDNEGIIMSPEYPNYYPRGINYTWKILAPVNNLILFEFNDFNTKRFDILKITEVSDSGFTSLANYSGSIKPDRFLSNTNEVILKFNIINSTYNLGYNFEWKGFKISYKFIRENDYLIYQPRSLRTQNSTILCDGTIEEFTSEHGTITSDNYPNQYSDNLTCQFGISVNSDEIVIATFESFATQPDRDILRIYDGRNSSSELVRSLSGYVIIPDRIVSTSNYLYFTFTTDYNISKFGFKLSYKSIKKVSVANLTESEGIIVSPEYPNYYQHGLVYNWNISAPDNNLILLEFDNFDTEKDEDILRIYGVSNNEPFFLAKYSGSVNPNKLLSNTNEVMLRFTSYRRRERKGFKISYKFIKDDIPKYLINRSSSHIAQNSNLLCDGRIEEFTSDNGTITSYNYPDQYSDNLTCKFRISVKSDEIIDVNFEYFSTELYHDNLKIYDGFTNPNNLVSTYVYSGKRMPFTIESFSNYLYFIFTTDNTHTEIGFKLNYKTIKLNNQMRDIQNDWKTVYQ